MRQFGSLGARLPTELCGQVSKLVGQQLISVTDCGLGSPGMQTQVFFFLIGWQVLWSCSAGGQASFVMFELWETWEA